MSRGRIVYIEIDHPDREVKNKPIGRSGRRFTGTMHSKSGIPVRKGDVVTVRFANGEEVNLTDEQGVALARGVDTDESDDVSSQAPTSGDNSHEVSPT